MRVLLGGMDSCATFFEESMSRSVLIAWGVAEGDLCSAAR